MSRMAPASFGWDPTSGSWPCKLNQRRPGTSSVRSTTRKKAKALMDNYGNKKRMRYSKTYGNYGILPGYQPTHVGYCWDIHNKSMDNYWNIHKTIWDIRMSWDDYPTCPNWFKISTNTTGVKQAMLCDLENWLKLAASRRARPPCTAHCRQQGNSLN